MDSSEQSPSIAIAFAVAALQRGESPEEKLFAIDLVDRIGINSGTRVTGKQIPRQLDISITSRRVSQPAGTGETFGRTNEDEDCDDAERRLAKSRERNREHARRTRQRKKAHLKSLQSRVNELEDERKSLTQKMEECNIASILLALSAKTEKGGAISCRIKKTAEKTPLKAGKSTVSVVTGDQKKCFLAETNDYHFQPEPLHVTIDGETTVVGEGSHVNWKTGVYSDKSGIQRKLSNEQLTRLRRERNRMHAKLTRNRKKCLISVLEKTIDDIEAVVKNMREAITNVSDFATSKPPDTRIVSPSASPGLISIDKNPNLKNDEDVCAFAYVETSDNEIGSFKRVKHGYSLACTTL